MRDTVISIERFAVSLGGNPLRYKTATCDVPKCGYWRNDQGTIAQVAAKIRMDGWLVSDGDEPSVMCPGCAGLVWAQL